MSGPNLARARYATPAEGITVPRTVEALLAKHGLYLAVDPRAHHEQPILRLVDEATGVPVRRLPQPLAEALSRLAAPSKAPRRRQEKSR